MYIYGGKCRFCECGIPSGIKDHNGDGVFTGDIVFLYQSTDDLGVTGFHGITVVVADHYENYVGQEPIKKDELEQPFIMGIKNSTKQIEAPLKDYPDTTWRIQRVKSYKDVIDGEHWREYGFNYKNK